MNEYIKKGDLLRNFDLKLAKWKEYKEKRTSGCYA